MAKVIFGNHSSVMVPRQDRDRICKFYCDVLGGKITKADPERDFLRLGEDFYIGFLYGDVLMRASSYGLQDRYGWKSSQTTWRK
jgi:catechol 2,3-dioxygenase-like lactoylglutathione lyase family enzyme